MLRTSPPARNIGPFRDSSSEVDCRSDTTTETDEGPHGSPWGSLVNLLFVLGSDDGRHVVGSVEPEHGQVNNPDTVEVDKHVEPRATLPVGLEEALLPVDILELEVTLSGRNVHQLALVLENDAVDTLGVPKELVAVIVTDNLLVISFATDVNTFVDLVTLIAAVAIQRGDDVVEEGELLNRFDHVLAGGRVQVVIGALEEEAQTLGHEADLVGLAPDQKIKGELSHTVMLRHPVHTSLPTEFSRLQRVVTLQLLKDFGFVLGLVTLGLLLGALQAALLALEVGETDGIIQIQMGSEIPLAVVCVVATNVIGMERKKGLVGGHAGSAGVEKRHEMVVHVAHAVTLETKLCAQIQEDILHLLL